MRPPLLFGIWRLLGWAGSQSVGLPPASPAGVPPRATDLRGGLLTKPLRRPLSSKPPRRALSIAIGLVLAAVAVACTPLGETGPLSGAYAKTIGGPDVASFQHPNNAGINWAAVCASGARFAFVKLSEGSTYTNPFGAADYRNARAAGLYVAGYHFARPKLPLSTAATDARRFAAQVGNVRQPGFMPPVLDIEVTGGLSAANITSWTRTFLTTLSAAVGRTPIIYTGGWFWRGYMGNPSGFSQYPLWAAQYNPS